MDHGRTPCNQCLASSRVKSDTWPVLLGRSKVSRFRQRRQTKTPVGRSSYLKCGAIEQLKGAFKMADPVDVVKKRPNWARRLMAWLVPAAILLMAVGIVGPIAC